MSAAVILKALRATRFRFRDEAGLQKAVDELLFLLFGGGHRREVQTGKGRIDFAHGSVAIELKVDGSTNEVRRQLKRYAELEWVEEIILVTACAKHVMPQSLHGKPVHVVRVCAL
jgi:hypothetical protein